jgi:exosortase/archaeosortase family protein
MVSYLVAYFVPLRGYVRVLMVASTPVTAVVCNVIRLLPTVWVFGHESAETGAVFHDLSGWIMLPMALALQFSIMWILRWAMVPVSPFVLAKD